MLDQLPTPRFPVTWGQIWTALWVLFLSGWGGAVSFWRKRQDGRARPFNIAELIGDMCTSGFAGVMTYLVCSYLKLDPLLTAATVGMAGHMGSKTINAIEKWLDRRNPMYDPEKKG